MRFPQFRWRALALYAALLALIATLYWPITRGGFVWDDTSSLHDQAQLRTDDWLSFAFHGFGSWDNYFRPLPALLFAMQVRAFDAAPQPMHAISLSLHLANTLLVGMLAWRVASLRRVALTGLAMALYGLHPALIEPVDWIGCQVELVLVFFTLLGLLHNLLVATVWARTFAVGACFFAAACTKESAAVFPLALVVFDLMSAHQDNLAQRIRATWRRQRLIYAGVLCAGFAYLALRYSALGHLLAPHGMEPLLLLERVQLVCLTYLEYWRLVVWPMSSIGPIHPADTGRLADVSLLSLAVDSTAIAILATGLLAFRKNKPAGYLVVAVTVALLPVLHAIPVGINESLYHDRYAATAVALACTLLPNVFAPLLQIRRGVVATLCLACSLWLGLAMLNIRATVPLWADELALWQWAQREHPDSAFVESHLLSTYLLRNDYQHARVLADKLVASPRPNPIALLNAAHLAVVEGDATRAAHALDRLKQLAILGYDVGMLHGYLFAQGELSELEGNPADAEDAYREAIKLDTRDPVPQITLAMLLARQGRAEEAVTLANVALALFAPDERERRRREFATALSGTATP